LSRAIPIRQQGLTHPGFSASGAGFDRRAIVGHVPSNFDVAQLEAFLAVVRLGTMAAAAESEHLSTSSLSKQIRRLEESLGSQLLDRRRGQRKVSLTPAGAVFRDWAAQALDDWQQTLRVVRRYGTTAKSSIALGSLPILSCYGLAASLARFLLENSSVQLEVVEREQENLLRRLDFAQLSLAIARTDRLPVERYRWRPLIQDELVLVAPQDHPLCGARRVPLSRLKGERFVTFHPESLLCSTFMDLARHSAFEPNVVASLSRHDLVMSAVAQGAGLALVPRGLTKGPNADKVALLGLDTPAFTETGVVWLRSRRLNTVERLLLDHLRPATLTDNLLAAPGNGKGQ
jgi:DNA-binding transcriptional LysR family regulator